MRPNRVSSEEKVSIGVRTETENVYTFNEGQKKREADLRELNDMYTECLWYMENDKPYAEHIYDLQTYLEYCLDRKVDAIPEGWIPRKGHIDKLAYAKCLERITELLFATGLLRELLGLKTETVYVDGEAFIDG